MHVKVLLNRTHPIKGFVYQNDRLVDPDASVGSPLIEVDVVARKGSRPICSNCARKASIYDTQPLRRFRFVPLWGIAVFLLYAPRRANCKGCGPTVEWMPWCEPGGKSPVTLAMSGFLASWAKRLSWKETGEVFNVGWDAVYRSVKSAVTYGLKHRDLSGVTAIGVDEVSYKRGHKYATLVYQIDAGRRRLLHVADGRSIKSFRRFFAMMKSAGRSASKATGERVDHLGSIRYVCSDMLPAYRKVIADQLPHALHILDRFHIVANLAKALDQIRAKEAKQLEADGYEPVLSKTRWLFLHRRKNLSGKQELRLRDVLKFDLKTVQAYVLVESLNGIWDYTRAAWAGKFLDAWCAEVEASDLEPLKVQARSLKKHRELILNWFRARKQYSSGIVEGLNGRVKVRFRKAFGYRTLDAIQVALYHELDDLPVRPVVHRFCG